MTNEDRKLLFRIRSDNGRCAGIKCFSCPIKAFLEEPDKMLFPNSPCSLSFSDTKKTANDLLKKDIILKIIE